MSGVATAFQRLSQAHGLTSPHSRAAVFQPIVQETPNTLSSRLVLRACFVSEPKEPGHFSRLRAKGPSLSRRQNASAGARTRSRSGQCKCLLSASRRNPVTLALASQGTQSLTPTAYQYQHKNAKPFRPRVCACLISAPKEPSHSRACEPRNPVTRADKASESFGRVRRLSQKLQVDAALPAQPVLDALRRRERSGVCRHIYEHRLNTARRCRA